MLGPCECEAEHGDFSPCQREREGACPLCRLEICLNCMDGDEGQPCCSVCYDSLHVREEVCGTCANRRTASATRSQYLTPIAGLGSTRVRLVGKVVAGLEITGISVEEGVVCECHDQDCRCGATCTRPATYLWGGVDHDDWQYLCRICGLRLVDRGTAPDRGEEVAEDA